MESRSGVRVMLADPPLGPHGHPHALASPNLGLLYVASYLRHSIPNVEVSYLDAGHSSDQHLQRVDEFRPHIYGISFASPYASCSYEMINRVKPRHPGMLVVCGGPHPTAMPADVLTRSQADACCLGEGEQTFAEVVQRHMAGGNISAIKGIATGGACGSVLANPPRPAAACLDDLPLPAWDLVDFRRFPGCRPSRGTVATAIVASRGCPFQCTFCSSPVWQAHKPKVRFRSPDNIAEEVALLYRRGVREVYIRSDTMNADPDWCVAVFESLHGLGWPDLRFQCNLRAQPVTNELARALRRANCWLVNIGVESGSQRVLDGIGKGITLNDIERSLEVLAAHGIRVRAFLMFHQVWEEQGRLRVETSAEVRQTLRFILQQRIKGRVHYVSWALATPYPGSQMYDVASRHGLIDNSPRSAGIRNTNEISMQVPGVRRWQILLNRALGLTVQGICAAIGAQGYVGRRQLPTNARVAWTKIKYALRPW